MRMIGKRMWWWMAVTLLFVSGEGIVIDPKKMTIDSSCASRDFYLIAKESQELVKHLKRCFETTLNGVLRSVTVAGSMSHVPRAMATEVMRWRGGERVNDGRYLLVLIEGYLEEKEDLIEIATAISKRILAEEAAIHEKGQGFRQITGQYQIGPNKFVRVAVYITSSLTGFEVSDFAEGQIRLSSQLHLTHITTVDIADSITKTASVAINLVRDGTCTSSDEYFMKLGKCGTPNLKWSAKHESKEVTILVDNFFQLGNDKLEATGPLLNDVVELFDALSETFLPTIPHPFPLVEHAKYIAKFDLTDASHFVCMEVTIIRKSH